jgi:hypothetical protein
MGDVYLHTLRSATKTDADGIKANLNKRSTGECFVTLPNALKAVDAVFVDTRLSYSGQQIQMGAKAKHQLKAQLQQMAVAGTDVPSDAVCGRYAYLISFTYIVPAHSSLSSPTGLLKAR